MRHKHIILIKRLDCVQCMFSSNKKYYHNLQLSYGETFIVNGITICTNNDYYKLNVSQTDKLIEYSIVMFKYQYSPDVIHTYESFRSLKQSKKKIRTNCLFPLVHPDYDTYVDADGIINNVIHNMNEAQRNECWLKHRFIDVLHCIYANNGTTKIVDKHGEHIFSRPEHYNVNYYLGKTSNEKLCCNELMKYLQLSKCSISDKYCNRLLSYFKTHVAYHNRIDKNKLFLSLLKTHMQKNELY